MSGIVCAVVAISTRKTSLRHNKHFDLCRRKQSPMFIYRVIIFVRSLHAAFMNINFPALIFKSFSF